MKVSFDAEHKGKRRMVLDVEKGTSSSDVLAAVAEAGLDVVSYRELIPSMNDIFIKLVKGEDK